MEFIISLMILVGVYVGIFKEDFTPEEAAKGLSFAAIVSVLLLILTSIGGLK